MENPGGLFSTGWSGSSNGLSEAQQCRERITIQDYELEAIVNANTPAGMSWKQILYNNPDSPNGPLGKLGEAYFASALGEKMWQRTDGAILWLRSHVIVRLELPAARQREAQLKIRKDQKARAEVPKF